MLLGANRILDYVFSMDMQLITLKQHALWVISVAITGSACRKLLDILEATYGYPETLESRQQGMSLARFSHYPSAPEPEFPEETLEAAEEARQSAELTAALQIEPQTAPGSFIKRPATPTAEVRPSKVAKTSSGPKPKGKAVKSSGQGAWLKPVIEAIPLHLLNKSFVHVTGIDEKKHLKADTIFRKSIYKCIICLYTTEQHAQVVTHIQGMHLSTCLACRLCGYRTYCSVDFVPHLEKKYSQQESDLYAPLPDLSSIVVKQEIKEEEIFSDCDISGVKAPKEVETILLDTDSDSD